MSYDYYKDFGWGLLYRVQGNLIEVLVEDLPGSEPHWRDSGYASLQELNAGYKGSDMEAVPVNENGERL